MTLHDNCLEKQAGSFRLQMLTEKMFAIQVWKQVVPRRLFHKLSHLVITRKKKLKNPPKINFKMFALGEETFKDAYYWSYSLLSIPREL